MPVCQPPVRHVPFHAAHLPSWPGSCPAERTPQGWRVRVFRRSSSGADSRDAVPVGGPRPAGMALRALSPGKEITSGSASSGSSAAADSAGGVGSAGDAGVSGAVSGAAGSSTWRRMRAVTGSSALAALRGLGPLRGGLEGVGGFQGLDAVGGLGDRRKRRRSLLRRRPGKSRLELVAQLAEFGQVAVMGERFAQAGLVVAELALGDRQVLGVRLRSGPRSRPPGGPGRSAQHAGLRPARS